jgi:gamma-glutamyl hydrolase
MGFQLLSILIANDSNVLCENCFDSYNLPLPLDFTSLAANSRLYGNLPNDVIQSFATKNITINLHHDGVAPSTYENNPRLSSFVNLLSTNVDRKGNPFGSSFEAKKVPIYATQYHPERNSVSHI